MHCAGSIIASKKANATDYKARILIDYHISTACKNNMKLSLTLYKNPGEKQC